MSHIRFVPSQLTVLCLEKHHSSPVVRFILDEAAGSALRKLRGVVCGVHGDVEGVTSDDLMKMRCVLHAGVDKRICSFDDKLRASKSQHILCSNIPGEGRCCSE
jgi:hypothetical protein